MFLSIYFFKEEAEAPFLNICQKKDYILSYKVELKGQYTQYPWNEQKTLQEYVSISQAYLRIDLMFLENQENSYYVEDIYDLLNEFSKISSHVDYEIAIKNGLEYDDVLFFLTFAGKQNEVPMTKEEIQKHLQKMQE